MAKQPESKERYIQEKKLECPICKNDKFWTRKTLMNTPGMTLFGIEWANKSATNYICDTCGHVLWFVEK